MAGDPHHARAASRPLSISWADKYVGIPWSTDGADFSGCNCWTLVRLALRTEHGIELPIYGEVSAIDIARAARRISTDSGTRPWRKVESPHEFDVALMTARTSSEAGHRTVPGHVGIMTSATHVLHVWLATDAVAMPINHPRLQQKILGFYRHEALSD